MNDEQFNQWKSKSSDELFLILQDLRERLKALEALLDKSPISDRVEIQSDIENIK